MSEERVQFHSLYPVDGMPPLEQAIWEIEAHLEAEGWDERPTYWITLKSDAGLALTQIHLPSPVYWNPGIMLPPFVEAVRTMPEAHEILSRTVGKIGAAGTDMERISIYAMGLFFESWSLDPEVVPYGELVEAFSTQSVHLHPQRLEERCGLFVTVDGDWVIIDRIRGRFPNVKTANEWDGDIEARGSIVTALRDLLALFTLDMK